MSALVAQDGSGRKSDPFRYWLPHRLAQWEQDPLYQLRERAEADVRRLATGQPLRLP